MRQRECSQSKGCRHDYLHSDYPPALGTDYIHKGAPERFYHPWKIKKGGIHSHITIRHSHICKHDHRDCVYNEIWDSFGKIKGRDPSPRIYALRFFHFLFFFQIRPGIIMFQNLSIIISLYSHYSRTYLTQTDSMAPTGTEKTESSPIRIRRNDSTIS